MIDSARSFVPICLYPHTMYRTRNGATDLFKRFELHRCEYLIVVADRLHALDNLVTGRYWSEETVYDKARREAKQIYNMIRRVAKVTNSDKCGKIVFWDEIAESAEFKEYSVNVRREFLAESVLSSALEEFVSRRVDGFGLGASPERERGYEREYLLSEVCMSVFCTEVLGYWQEIWERPPRPNIPDPLRLLYNQCPEAVVRATGRPPRRVLRFLYDESEGP
jgi:hypothetical protein